MSKKNAKDLLDLEVIAESRPQRGKDVKTFRKGSDVQRKEIVTDDEMDKLLKSKFPGLTGHAGMLMSKSFSESVDAFTGLLSTISKEQWSDFQPEELGELFSSTFSRYRDANHSVDFEASTEVGRMLEALVKSLINIVAYRTEQRVKEQMLNTKEMRGAVAAFCEASDYYLIPQDDALILKNMTVNGKKWRIDHVLFHLEQRD